MERYLRLLRNHPDFTRLWLSQVISLLGDWFSTIVLAAMVREYTAGSSYEGLAVSALFITQVFPPLLVSSIAGALVDRFDRKRLLVWSNWLRAIVVLGLLFVRSADTLWLLYVLRVVQFVLSAVFEPGQSALVPTLVDFKDLTIANTLLSTTWSVMLAVGAVIGGIVGALLGPDVALVIDALTFVVAGWLIVSIRTSGQPIPELNDDGTESDQSFQDALRYLRNHPEKISPLTVKLGISVGNMDTILTFYATNIFVLGARGELSIGIMYSAFGVGAILGPLLLNAFHRDTLQGLRRMIWLGFVWVTLGWLGIGTAPTLWLMLAAIALRAMGNSANWVYSTTMIQKTVPNRYLGRVFAIDMAGFYLLSGVSLLAHGMLIDQLGSEQVRLVVYGTAAVSVLPILAWSYVVMRPRPMQEVPHPAPPR